MRFVDWRKKTWLQRILMLLTVAVLVLLASHPELRLFAPLVDLLGIDLLCLLMASQTMAAARPAFVAVHRLVLVPAGRRAYASVIFFLGIAGPYVDGQLRGLRTMDVAANGKA